MNDSPTSASSEIKKSLWRKKRVFAIGAIAWSAAAIATFAVPQIVTFLSFLDPLIPTGLWVKSACASGDSSRNARLLFLAWIAHPIVALSVCVSAGRKGDTLGTDLRNACRNLAADAEIQRQLGKRGAAISAILTLFVILYTYIDNFARSYGGKNECLTRTDALVLPMGLWVIFVGYLAGIAVVLLSSGHRDRR